MKKEKIKENVLNNELFEKNIVDEVLKDFHQRQMERKTFDKVWQLNTNFYLGNQYCQTDKNGEIVDNYKQYFWEEREVYNHIAPLIEIRLSKLARVRPKLTVVPFSDEQNDIACAKVSKKILDSTTSSLNLSKIITQNTMWSEICGTSFYKVAWNANLGKVIGMDENGVEIKEGDVEISTISPYEIYPDSNTYNNIEDCRSVIHARAFHKDLVKNLWGIEIEGEDIDIFSLENINNSGGLGYFGGTTCVAKKVKKEHVLVIEKFEMPTVEFPNGRVILIAGNKLIHIDELPFINMPEGKRGFPFIKQCSIPTPNCFWGSSIIERCIPIQRAYNAVKNRKHEFLNRISMGILAVEDGSLDTDNLEEEGLSPGKVLVYRQGASIPHLLSTGSVPMDFQHEENQLLNEFLSISGVSDLFNGRTLSNSTSGVALQLLIEQDEARLTTSSEEIRTSAKELAKHILRIYKQFAVFPHSSRIINENGSVEIFYWQNSDISSEDVQFETENEMNGSPAQKRSTIYEILNTGLLHDEDGKISNALRHKLLEQLGFGVWEGNRDIKALQVNNANKENAAIIEFGKMPEPKEIDDHEIHINEHICFMLSNNFEKITVKNPEYEKKILEHIKLHKKFQNLMAEYEAIIK